MSTGATAAAGGSAAGGAGGGRGTRARLQLPVQPFDPHTGRDLRRKLTDRDRCLLDDLHARLTFVDDRLQAIAGRHGEAL